MRNHTPSGRSEWARIVAAFEKSDQSQPDFCAARRLNLMTFRSWLYRIRREGGGSGPKLVELVPPASSDDVECVVRVGTSEIRFASLPDAEYLAAVLRAVDDR